MINRTLPRLKSIGCLVLLAGAAIAAAPGTAASSSGCHLVASPSGSDSAPGTEAAPFRTAQRLIEAVSPGQTACLRQGTYTGSDLRLEAPGSTFRSYPGERATIAAFFAVYPEATGAKVMGLRFDGTNVNNDTAVKVNADRSVFSGNEVTKGGNGICLQAGSWHPARGVVIERNRVYRCGPPSSKFDHQLYLGQTRGAVVRFNVLTDNPGGWGVHLYTDADNTLIENNIIDNNRGGVIFAGEGGEHSDNNVVRNNAITNNGPRWNIEGSWSGGPFGTGNTAYNNCVYSTGPDAPAGIAERDGFSTGSNTVLKSDPYVNGKAGDYRFKAGSPCAALTSRTNARTAAAKPAAPKVKLRFKRKRARPGRKAVLFGRVVRAPKPGARVHVQIRINKRWRTIAQRPVGPRGGFKVTFRTHQSKRYRVRRFRAMMWGAKPSRVKRLKITR